MDQDTLDDGSLNIFNLDTGVDPGVNANPSSKSVTYTLDRPLEPGTRYEAHSTLTLKTTMVTFWTVVIQMTSIQVVDGSLSPQPLAILLTLYLVQLLGQWLIR